VADLDAVSAAAHAHGVPFIVDNTFAPLLARPFDHGVDIIVHSATKWIGGHGTAIGGVVVDSGKFDWAASPRFHEDFVAPDPSYHGVSYTEAFGPLAFILKLRVVGLRDLGAALSPWNAWQFIQGLETLPLRIERHSQNALKVAQWLQDRPEIEWVNYPGLASHPTHELAKKYLGGGFGGVLTFGVKGGETTAKKVISASKLFSLVANVGDAKSLVIHPWSTTHEQLAPEDRIVAGVTPDLIRLSVGIEDVEDLTEDLDQALRKAVRS
jgi:O-acetylhomoserine (thiol)-lyase